jgi:sarcosine oxidase
MGAATAWQLSRRGVDAVLLEQFALGHDRGSSRGPTRMFRHAYAESDYVRLMRDALDQWAELENESGETLLRRTGAVDIGSHVADCARAMREVGVEHDVLDPESALRAFPMVRFSPEDQVLYHPGAGICFSARALRVCKRLAVSGGVDLLASKRRYGRRGDCHGVVWV